MCVIDLEPCDVWVETDHKARTAKECDSCRGPILPGAQYVKHFSKYDGEITSNVMCKPCESDRAEFGAAHDHLVPVPEAFQRMLADCVDESDDSDRWTQMLAGLRARKAATAPGLAGRLSLGRV